MPKAGHLNDLEFIINPDRLRYLLDLYKLSKEEFLLRLQGTNKKPLLGIGELDEILERKRKVRISLIKKMDRIFEKGITWYISKRGLPSRKDLSIFFRKDRFNSALSEGSIKQVERFERKMNLIETLCNDIDYKIVKKYNFRISHDPSKAAKELRKACEGIRTKLKKDALLKRTNTDRDFLENLIRTIEEFNVFVFEFTEPWNKKGKVDFNGFFISPNMIVIKRQQDYFKREIFTLMHEFAHYLLDEEEIDDEVGGYSNQSDIERWCNDFAYQFLVGDYSDTIDGLSKVDASNNFHQGLLEEISSKTRLSTLSLYTRLRIIDKISAESYKRMHEDIIDSIAKRIEEKKNRARLERELAKERGAKPPFASSPKRIRSKLFKEIVKISYFQGNISEGTVLESLGMKNKSINEVVYS